MLVEQDRQRAERFRDCMQDSRVSMQLQVVSSDLDALDLLTIQAEFNRNELPDILVLGTGASMKNGSYNIMRFIHDEAQFAGMQVVAFTEALSC